MIISDNIRRFNGTFNHLPNFPNLQPQAFEKIASELQGITYIDGEKEANARQSIKEWLNWLKKTTE